MKYDSDWISQVIGFLKENIPKRDGDWDHGFVSPYEMGCEALAALGQAQLTGWGAVTLEKPGLPKCLPRWDDLAVVVLFVAVQNDKVRFSSETDERADGRRQIASGYGPARARVRAGALAAFEALELMHSGAWTRKSETVFWRMMSPEQGRPFTLDLRFCSAVDAALRHMPEAIRLALDRLNLVDDREGHPIGELETMRIVRRFQMDYLFFTRWRLEGGWLTPEEADRTLFIFHDHLAICMRRAIAERLYPDSPWLAA